MWNFVIGCAFGALMAACICAPLLLPWPMRVRYLISAPMTDPWTGLALAPRLYMRAVRLSAVERDYDDVVELSLEDLDTGHQTRVIFAGSACVPSVLAKLDGWLVPDSPLLMIVEDDHVQVYGPDGALTNLNLARERIR